MDGNNGLTIQTQAKTKNRLNTIQTLQLGAWLQKMNSTGSLSEMSADKLAAVSTPELGFNVTKANVSRMCRDLNITIKDGLPEESETLTGKVVILSEKIDSLNLAIEAMSETLDNAIDLLNALTADKQSKKPEKKETPAPK